jgi:hypothetical protein
MVLQVYILPKKCKKFYNDKKPKEYKIQKEIKLEKF